MRISRNTHASTMTLHQSPGNNRVSFCSLCRPDRVIVSGLFIDLQTMFVLVALCVLYPNRRQLCILLYVKKYHEIKKMRSNIIKCKHLFLLGRLIDLFQTFQIATRDLYIIYEVFHHKSNEENPDLLQ